MAQVVGAAAPVALLAGASGLVGQALLAELLGDEHYAGILSLARRPGRQQHPRLTERVIEFKAVPTLPPVSHAFIALGTTLAAAGSEEAFRKIDLDAVVAVARAAKAAGATRLGVVSAMGAALRSGIFYNRVKGEMEEAVSALGFECVVLAQPGLIAGNRRALGQRPRRMEGISLAMTSALGPLVPPSFRPIDATVLARALRLLVQSAPAGVHRPRNLALLQAARSAAAASHMSA